MKNTHESTKPELTRIDAAQLDAVQGGWHDQPGTRAPRTLGTILGELAAQAAQGIAAVAPGGNPSTSRNQAR